MGTMAALDDVATSATVGFALVIAIITTMFRRLVELRWPSLSNKTPLTREQRIWEKLVLPSVPVLFAVTFCLFAQPKQFSYPLVAERTLLSRVIYGVVVGWFADFGYRAVVFFLKRKWNIAMPGASDAPGPVDVVPAPYTAVMGTGGTSGKTPAASPTSEN